MPKYNFLCDTCGREKEKICASSVTEADCGCGGKLKRLLPRSLSTTVMEMKDPYRGKQLPKGHQEKMRERFNQHHDKYEVEEKIDKYGQEDAQKFGWDKKRQKV